MSRTLVIKYKDSPRYPRLEVKMNGHLCENVILLTPHEIFKFLKCDQEVHLNNILFNATFYMQM